MRALPGQDNLPEKIWLRRHGRHLLSSLCGLADLFQLLVRLFPKHLLHAVDLRRAHGEHVTVKVEDFNRQLVLLRRRHADHDLLVPHGLQVVLHHPRLANQLAVPPYLNVWI